MCDMCPAPQNRKLDCGTKHFSGKRDENLLARPVDLA